jgi:hypothetical protein
LTALHLARSALPIAVALFFVAVVLGGLTDDASFILLVPAGLLLALRGYLMLSRRQRVLGPLVELERKGINGRLGLSIEHPFGALLFLVIGSGWTVSGFVVAL